MLRLVAAEPQDFLADIGHLAGERAIAPLDVLEIELAGLFENDVILYILPGRLVPWVERAVHADVPVL